MPKVEINEKSGLVQRSGRGSHLSSVGGTPTAVFAGGSAAGAIEAQSTDMAGIINVTTQLANTNTLTVLWDKPYDSVPTVVVGTGLVNYSYTTTRSSLKITASGNTGTGEVHYIVVRPV